MNTKVIETYLDYMSRSGNRLALYRTVAKEFTIQSSLYPGCHIDITPSLVIPNVSYIDNFKGAIDFFKSMESIEKYVLENKEYPDPCEMVFMGQDYTQPLGIEKVDLRISQYAGFVGQATKQYLKIGGFLLCNDSHGDATLAKSDTDFEFIGIVNGTNEIKKDGLENYFSMPKEKPIDLACVKEKMKGPKYKVVAENYLFKKIR